jgi:hypothetical protein
MPFAALFTMALVLLLDTPARPRPFALGVVLGLAHLTRPVMAPLLPAWLVAVAAVTPRGRRGRSLAFAALGFAPCAIALAVYQAAATGVPLAGAGGYLVLASLTPDLAVGRINRMMPPPEPLAFLAAHPGLLPAKFLAAVPSEAWQVALRLGRPLAALLALRLFAPADARERGFRVALFGSAALLLALSALTVPDPRMVFPLLPALVAVAFDEARRLLESRGFGPRGVALACAALLLAGGARAALSDWRRAAGGVPDREGFREREWSELGERLDAALPPGVTVASDAAPWVAWYARRPATLVPLGFDGLRELEARTALGALVVTNEWLIHRPGEAEWRGAFEGRAAPAGWTESRRVAAGRLAAVVFTRAAVR